MLYLSKVCEICIYNSIFSQVCNSTSSFQHGFMDKRSIIANLVQFTHFTSEALDDGSRTYVIYANFIKGCERLDQFNITKVISFWIHELFYLSL